MATGLPVITTLHSGLPEQVIDGRNGFLVPESDYKTLADKIEILIQRPELWSELGRNGRIHVAKCYNSDIMIERQIDCYLELTQETHSLPKQD